jgi:hypothetical protein
MFQTATRMARRIATLAFMLPLREETRTWFAISLQTFGGSAGQIAVMQRTLVDEKRWIGQGRELLDLGLLIGARTRAGASIDIRLDDPAPHGLPPDTDLARQGLRQTQKDAASNP